MPPFNSATLYTNAWLVDIFSLSFSVQKLFNTFVFAYKFHSWKNFGSWVFLDSLMLLDINKTQKGTALGQTASFEPSCVLVRRSIRAVLDCEKKYFFYKFKRKKSESLYNTCVLSRRDALTLSIVTEVCTCVTVIDV